VPLDERAEDVQREHVEQQVHRARVQELERNHPPELKSVDGEAGGEVAPELEPPEPHLVPLGRPKDVCREHEVEQKDGDVDRDQRRRDRRLGEQLRERVARPRLVSKVFPVCEGHVMSLEVLSGTNNAGPVG
jgi:hypothetical protein